MAKNMTEDAVRDLARETLGLVDSDIAHAGVGQLVLLTEKFLATSVALWLFSYAFTINSRTSVLSIFIISYFYYTLFVKCQGIFMDCYK